MTNFFFTCAFDLTSGCGSIGWKYLAISMISVATAMLCKEQGITVTAICAVYEIFVIQKVSLVYFFFSFLLSKTIFTINEKS